MTYTAARTTITAIIKLVVLFAAVLFVFLLHFLRFTTMTMKLKLKLKLKTSFRLMNNRYRYNDDRDRDKEDKGKGNKIKIKDSKIGEEKNL